MFNSLTHKSLRANNVLNALVHRYLIYRKTQVALSRALAFSFRYVKRKQVNWIGEWFNDDISKSYIVFTKLRMHVSQVKQRYEIPPDPQKGANNETENHTRIDFVRLSFIFKFNSLTHRSLIANNVLDALVYRYLIYRKTQDALSRTLASSFRYVKRKQVSWIGEWFNDDI